jgi:hypothetical protein
MMADSTGKDLDDALKALEEPTIIANKFMEVGGLPLFSLTGGCLSYSIQTRLPFERPVRPGTEGESTNNSSQ